jgi:GNAT superfamily N-acetyltransferase
MTLTVTARYDLDDTRADRIVARVLKSVAAQVIAAQEVAAQEVPAQEVPAQEVPAQEVAAQEVAARAAAARAVPAQAVPAQGVAARARFVAVVAEPGDALANVGRAVEDGTGDEFRPYEDRSSFVVVLDRERGTAAGAARVIEGPHTRALHEVPPLIGRTEAQVRAAHGLDDGGTIMEIASLAVRPRYRGKRSGVLVSTLIYRALIRLGRDRDVRHVVAVLDRDAYRSTVLLGFPVVPMAGSRPFRHRGCAEKHAVYGDFTRFEPAIAEQAARLRRSSRPGCPQLRRVDQRTFAQRRVGAGIARRLATGDGLDELILRSGKRAFVLPEPRVTGAEPGRGEPGRG